MVKDITEQKAKAQRSFFTDGKQTRKKADPHRFKGWVEYLAEKIGPRPYTKPALLKKVAEDLAAGMADLDLDVKMQGFSFKGQTYFNVIGKPAQKGRTGASVPEKADRLESAPLIIVGAHYDTVQYSPGADDNASGIAGLMELARVLGNMAPSNLRIVAFCLEEPPAFRTRHMGSYVYAKSLKKAGVKLKGMICLEMLGYFSDRPNSQSFPLFFMEKIYPNTGNFIALVGLGNRRSRKWTSEVKRAFEKGTDLPVESLNAPFFVVGVDLSDHWSFNKMGYPAVMVTDTAFYRNPHYHRPSDTPSTLDFVRAAKVVDGLAHAVLTLA